MRKKLLKTFIGVFALAMGFAFASCSLPLGQNEETASLQYELVNDSYKVVGIGTYEEGSLVIPETYKGKPVTAIGAEAFSHELEIGHLTIPDSVTTIEAKAFYSCTNLTQVTMGNGVTEIGSEAFAYCSTLETATLSDSLVTIGDSAFIACVRLKKAHFPDTLKTISNHAYEECKVLQKVTFGTSLETIGVRAFYNCIAIDGVEIPDGAPTDIFESAFFGCSSAERILLGDSVIGVGPSAFEGCSSAREVVLGDSVISIGNRAFAGCRKFYEITLGKSLLMIGEAAFEKCWLLREIYNRSASFVITLGSSKDGGIGYYAWYVRREGDPTRISKDENGLVYYTDATKKALIAVELTKNTDLVVPDDVTEIANYACYNEQLIVSLVIGKGCTRIGFSAFRNSYKINSVVLGENVTTIADSAFRYNGYIVTIVGGKNLKTVGEEAFMKKIGDRYYKPYDTFYFDGTPTDWFAITFGEGNEHLTVQTTNIAFYSEEAPVTSGSYWHYVDGKPTMWL